MGMEKTEVYGCKCDSCGKDFPSTRGETDESLLCELLFRHGWVYIEHHYDSTGKVEYLCHECVVDKLLNRVETFDSKVSPSYSCSECGKELYPKKCDEINFGLLPIFATTLGYCPLKLRIKHNGKVFCHECALKIEDSL